MLFPAWGQKTVCARILNESGYLIDDKSETGTLYTTLRRLEKKRLLVSNWETTPNEKRRRVYSITKTGKMYLKEIIESIIQRKPMIEKMITFYNKNYNKYEALAPA